MSAPDDLSARVSILERTVAKLEGKLEAELQLHYRMLLGLSNRNRIK